MNAREHESHRDEVGAYLLGALTDPEREAFERHLSRCAECRDELERLRPAADALPRSVEQLEPPPRLKAALMEVVDQDARQSSDAPARAAGPSLGERLRRPFGTLRPALAMAALALGAIAGYGVAQLAGDEDARTIVASVDESRIPDASARLQVQGDGENGAILRVQGMPSLDPDRVYQAWLQRDGTIVPQPTFEVQEDGGGAVAIPDDVSDAEAIMVTREGRGGARAPGEEPILVARL